MWLSVAVKYIRISWAMVVANLLSVMSFRLSFLLYIFGIVIFFGAQFFLWIVFFNQFPSVGGWTSKDMMLVYSLYIFSLSVLDVFAGGMGDLARIVNAGNLDYYLALPKPILWHIAVSKADVASVGPVVLSFIIFLFSGPIGWLRILLFLFASCFSMILFFNFLIISQSIVFFVGGFEQGASAVKHLLTIVTPYPFSVFPVPFKYILMSIVPSFFVVTMPARLVDSFSIQTLIVLVCVCLVVSFLANKVFKSGLRRYESGNMMNVRL
ncbi:MAG: hypothetical protein UR26_C0002G0140 [candidate division TM6 bacterium GW2011_GWF2_32_72]|nr:MAG: hypothetical protein UR26_C0002G0140 [candidate division TM6 bacterium GW2011_GWF2_32_72]